MMSDFPDTGEIPIYEPAPAAAPHADSVGQFALSIIAPGSAALRRTPFLALALLLVGVVLPVALFAVVFANRDQIIGLALDPTFLLIAIGVGIVAVLTRLVAVAEVSTAFCGTAGNVGRSTVATLIVLLLSTPVIWATSRAYDARSVVGNVFANNSDEPIFVPDPVTSASTVDPLAITNILLFGGDAGPGRWGMRTDTMILISIHDASGRTALVSIPRNLTRLQFPPGTPLANEYANGFDDLANAVFTKVNTRPDLVEAYTVGNLQPEAVALSQALGYSLDIEVDDYALVNMQGFTDVIDAVGGLTIEVGQSVPLPPSIPGERPLPPSVGPGVIDMDGALAIAYARSRSADSDYQRMGRQRQLLAALASQVSTSEAVRSFPTVTGALDDSMRTSLSAGQFDDLLQRLGDNSAIRESVGLAPPLITPGSPDYTQIRAIVDAVQQGLVSGQPSGFGG